MHSDNYIPTTINCITKINKSKMVENNENSRYYKQFISYLEKCTGDANVVNYRYAGGDTGRHANYWRTMGRTKAEMPAHKNICACGHDIDENCFIEHKSTRKLIVLGNCCIKRYIPDSGRTCERCGEPHKNRKDNRCNSCRLVYKCIRCNHEDRLTKWNIIDMNLDMYDYKCKDCTTREQINKRLVTLDERVYLHVLFANKDAAKSLGAKWEQMCKCWYIDHDDDKITARFPKLPQVLQQKYKEIVCKRYIDSLALLRPCREDSDDDDESEDEEEN
jgi:hypothetical protein